MNDILRYDHTMTTPFFDEDGLTSKPNKYELVKGEFRFVKLFFQN